MSVGHHIAIEGRDGVGKTVQVPRVAAALREQLGVSVRETREPGATPLGAHLREILLESDIGLAARTRLLLFAADNAQHYEDVVLPSLAAGEWVLSDRSMGSALAYQGFGFEFGTRIVEQIYGWAVHNHQPHLTVMLDCDDDIIVDRKAVHGEPADNIERLSSDFHTRVRDGYRHLASRDARWVIVDASGSIPEVTDQIVEAAIPAIERLQTTPSDGWRW